MSNLAAAAASVAGNGKRPAEQPPARFGDSDSDELRSEVDAGDPFDGDFFVPACSPSPSPPSTPRAARRGGPRTLRANGIEWRCVHVSVSKLVHEAKKCELFAAADSTFNRKPHAIGGMFKYVAKVLAKQRILCCAYKNNAKCPARWKEMHHEDDTFSLYEAVIPHADHRTATQKVIATAPHARSFALCFALSCSRR